MDCLTKHFFVDLYDCDPERVNNPEYLDKTIKELCTLIGLTPLYSLTFHQQTQGIIATMIVSEGYFGIQGWEKYGHMSFDIQSNIDIDNEKTLSFLIRKFGASKYSASKIKRGKKTEGQDATD